MKRYIVCLLLILAACAPAEVSDAPSDDDLDGSQVQMQINPPADGPVDETVTQPAMGIEGEGVDGTPLTPLEPTGYEYEPYSTLGCQNLLTAQEFSTACEVAFVDVTSKIGTKNCYINLRSREDERLTAGVSLLAFKNAEDAMTEFDRRLKIYVVGADRSVGEKAYTFPKLDRETLIFVRTAYLVEVGSDTRMCTKAQVKQLALVVDAKLK